MKVYFLYSDSTAKLFLSFLFGAFFMLPLWAQESDGDPTPPVIPVSVEGFFDDKGALVEMTMAKPFSPESRWGFLMLTEYYGDWSAKHQEENNSYMAQTHISYALFDNIMLIGGLFITDADGLRPTVGLEYFFERKNLFFLLVPRVDLTQSHNGEVLAYLTYTPPLKKDWSLYTRVEGLYNHDWDHGEHSYSYLRLRLGLSYKIFRFGIGTSFTSYGSEKFKDNRFGIFAGVLLF